MTWVICIINGKPSLVYTVRGAGLLTLLGVQPVLKTQLPEGREDWDP